MTLLIICFGLAGNTGTLYSEEDINFSTLLEGGKIISPPGSYETGKAEYNTHLTGFLDTLEDFLKKNPGLVIEIGGHSDNSGTPQINRRLSLRRAQRVKDYLIRKGGIIEARLVVKGYSSGTPIASNLTPEGKTRNRRVEIMALLNMDPAGRLTYIRREVLTRAIDKSDFIRATLNQGLFHMDRVLTRKKSNANVTFQDLSKINLGPQSLMIMYSMVEKGLQMPRKQNVRLSTGRLRTKLNKLKGALQVDTPACTVNSDSVEILVGIDEKKMSSLSVYDGKSTVAAQGKIVEVPKGYGTVVEMGEPPALPEPLPPAPQLVEPVKTAFTLPRQKNTIPVRFQWGRAQGSYHLQVALDSQFEKIIEDQVLPDNTATLSLAAGTYHWRAASINPKGLEGYASSSSFTVTEVKELPELPLVIAPVPKKIMHTAKGKLAVTGKTQPGTRISIKGQNLHVDDRGAFSGSIPLGKGWNHIQVRAFHRDFEEKIVWLTVYRYPLGESALSIVLRFDLPLEENRLDNAFTVQLGKTLSLSTRVETEFALGYTRLQWKDFPGIYKENISAVPFTAELHFMLGKGSVIPYVSTGVSAYLAFPRRRSDNGTETKLFISPEIGAGLAFPVLEISTRLEVKYTPFLNKEPFFPETAHRLAFILKLLL